MRTSIKLAISTGAAALLGIAPVVTNFGPVAQAACPNHSATHDTNGNATGTQYAAGDENGGGVYRSGNDVGSGSGYVGATGTLPVANQGGYVEAGGSTDPSQTSTGYIGSSNGGVRGDGSQC